MMVSGIEVSPKKFAAVELKNKTPKLKTKAHHITNTKMHRIEYKLLKKRIKKNIYIKF